MQSWCVGISTLLLSALLPWPGTGQFHVIGPGAPVIALIGKEAVLPCHLSPVMDAEDMDVSWYRSHPTGQVHHYSTSHDLIEHQRHEYRGRTEFLKENITKGQVALRIHPILPSDAGEYRCFFASSTFYNEAQFKILVTGSGTAPQIYIEPGYTGEMKLTCTSTGWYPEPEVQWRDVRGQRLTPASETKTAAENGLFHVETSVTVDTMSRDGFCTIRNPVLREEKEAQFSLSDAVFPRLWPWIVGFAVPLCLLAAGTTFSVLFVCTKRRKRLIKKQYGELKRKQDELEEDYDSLQKKYDEISMELARRKAIGEEGLKKVQRFAENIILDETTAHSYLEVSDDRKSVRSLKKKQSVSENDDRFNMMAAVLGENRFSSGDHYWEVKVEKKNRWTVGLCVDSVKRKGWYTAAYPRTGFWTICLKNSQYKALSDPRSILNVPEPLLVVGIFLQYEKGQITFYNVTDSIILYTFKSTFTEVLRPYFYPGPLGEGNMAGLHIHTLAVADPVSSVGDTAETPQEHPHEP